MILWKLGFSTRTVHLLDAFRLEEGKTRDRKILWTPVRKAADLKP